MAPEEKNKIRLLTTLRRKDEVSIHLYNRKSWNDESFNLESNVSIRPYMPSLARVYFQKYKESSLLLLPFYLQNGKVFLYKSNAAHIYDLIVNMSPFGSIILDNVHELSLEHPFTFLNAYFFHRFPNLKQLKIYKECTDTTLEFLSKYLPNLTLFDCSMDPNCQITDCGLEWLGQLKLLRHVFLKRCYPGQDHSMPNYTEIGIASLMKSLPELVKITFDSSRRFKAFKILGDSQSALLSLKSLDLTGEYLNSNLFSIVRRTCPNVDKLSITVREVNEELCCERLRHFKTIEELHVNPYETNVTIPKFITYVGAAFGMHLKVLDLITINLTFQEVCELSSTCPNLQRLTIFVTTKIGKGDKIPDWHPIHQNLKSLDYSGLDLRCLEAFMQKTTKLEKLYIICPRDGSMNVLWKKKASDKYCPKLETLLIQLPEKYPYRLPDHLANIFRSLKRISFFYSEIELVKIVTSDRGNEVFVEAVKGLLHPDYNEIDYLDG